MENNNFIPVCKPYLSGREEEYIIKAVRSGWISSAGKYIKQFEQKFAAFCGSRYGVCTTSGTTALHLALLASGIKEGDEVILPDFTIVAPVLAVLYCGAKPVFVDVELDTWNINPDMIEEKITDKTKAILPVHIYGHPAEMNSIIKIAEKYELTIIEDAAEAHGAEYMGKRCGSFGSTGCFSFYANKIITTGEGGMLVTDDQLIADKARYYRNLCFPLDSPRNYIHNDLGYNFRFTNIQAAIGLAQLENIDRFINLRRSNAQLYNELLKDIPGIKTPVERDNIKNVYWMYAVLIDPEIFGHTRDGLIIKLKERGIDSRVFFKPIHSQPFLKQSGFFDSQPYPMTEKIAYTGLYLPSSSSLLSKQIRYICDSIKAIHLETRGYSE